MAPSNEQNRYSTEKPDAPDAPASDALFRAPGEGPAPLADLLFASLFARQTRPTPVRRTMAKQQRLHADTFIRDRDA